MRNLGLFSVIDEIIFPGIYTCTHTHTVHYAVGHVLLLAPVCQSVLPGVSGTPAAPQHTDVPGRPHSISRVRS